MASNASAFHFLPMQNNALNMPVLPAEAEIVNAIHGIDKFVTNRSPKDWTHAVKRSFTELGLAHNWGVCASIPIKHEDVHREWLFDLTWYNSPNGRLRELGLVLESEWEKGFGKIQYDFEKLLIARAPYKVAVFDARESERPEFFNGLREIIKGYAENSKDEVYFLAAYSELKGGFEVDVVRPSTS